MAVEWTTGLFGLGGVALGVLVEPIKSYFTAVARRRQARTERVEKFVLAGAVLRDALADYNRVIRAIREDRARGDAKQFRSRMVRTINESRAAMRDAMALFWLYGPDSLAVDARDVMEAAAEVMPLIDELGDGEQADPLYLPDGFRAAAESFSAKLTEFSALSRGRVG